MILTVNILKKARPLEKVGLAFIFALLSGILLLTQSSTLLLAKGFLFAISLLLISFCDLKQQVIPDLLLLPILCVGMADIRWTSVAGFFFPSILFLIISCVGGLGGGDVKLMAVCGLVLGLHGALSAAFLGLTLFLLVHFRHRKQKERLYALAPYLSIGCFVAYAFIGGYQ